MRKLFIFLCFLCISSVSAQVPGYVGKTRHLQGGIKFFPSFGAFPVLVATPGWGYIVSGFNYRLELGMDFMISRKSSVGFNSHYFNTATRNNSGFSITDDYRIGLEGGGVGFVFKTHFGSWVAPLGPYYRVEGGALIYSLSDPANNFGGTYVPSINATGYITNAFGRTHIFANRISLDYGFEVGFVFPPYYDLSPSGMGNSRLAFHYLVNAYVKIGGIF